MVHHQDPVGVLGLVHVVGDEHHGDALLPVEAVDGGEDLLPAHGVQHGGGLVQDDAVRLHGDDARNGHPLLLPAGEEMGGVADELRHAHIPEGVVHPAADLCTGDAQVLRGEGHVLLHHVGNDLVVRVLEDHAHPLADGEEVCSLGGVHPLHQDLAAGGDEDGVHGLGQGGLAGAVVAQHHHEAALLNGEGDPVQGVFRLLALLRRVGEGDILQFDHGRHGNSPNL